MKKYIFLTTLALFYLFSPLSAIEINLPALAKSPDQDQTFLYSIISENENDLIQKDAQIENQELSQSTESNITTVSLPPGAIPEYIDNLDFTTFYSAVKRCCTADSCALDCSRSDCTNCTSCCHKCNDSCSGDECGSSVNSCSDENECGIDSCFQDCCCCCCEEEAFGWGFGGGGGGGIGGGGVGIGGIDTVGGGGAAGTGNTGNENTGTNNTNTTTGTDTGVIVPEPSTYLTLAVCLLVALYIARKRAQKISKIEKP